MSNIENFGNFKDQWLQPTVEPFNKVVWRLSEDAQARIRAANYTPALLLAKQRLAVLAMRKEMGDNPFVALSGGIDSQATCLLLKKSSVPFTAAIMEFEDGLNVHDVSSALEFCNAHGIPHVVVKFDILGFLGRTLPSYVEKYDCPSPQLLTHCRFYEMIIEQFNPTSIISGGNPPCIREGQWEFISNRSHSVWMTFAKLNKYPLIGNFLGYSLDIALPFMVLQPDMPADLSQRYQAKITGMLRAGLVILPQKQKFTGFELVKQHFANLTGDGWTFEKSFRFPHHRTKPEYDSIFEITDEIAQFLSEKHRELNKPETTENP